MSRVKSELENLFYMDKAVTVAERLSLNPRVSRAMIDEMRLIGLRLPDEPPQTEADQVEFDTLLIEFAALLLRASKETGEADPELEHARKTLETVAKELGAARAALS